MAKKQDKPEAFQQVPDPDGRIEMDRRLTPAEALAQDQEHREVFLRNRLRRFGDAPSDEAA